MGKTFFELANNLRNAIRTRATTIPDFKTGAIMLSFVVKSDDGNQFLGGFCGEDDSNVDVDLVYSIRPNSAKTRPNGFRGMTDGEVACRGYAALKIEGCAYAVRNNLGRRSCDMPDEAISYGRENDRGAVCFDIVRQDFNNREPFLRLYVAVSGASGKEDEWCAMAAGDVLKDWANTATDHYWKYDLIEPEDEKAA